MATSKTTLANIALTKLGKSRLTDIDLDTTENANVASLLFDEVRDQVLFAGPWAFAIKREELGLLGTSPEYEFDHQHQLPNDCLRVVEINELSPGDVDHRIEGEKILSNDTGMKIRYISKISDVGIWSPGFKETFVLKLAAEMAYAFRADKALTQGLFAQYQDALDRALAIDGKQGSNDTIVSTDLTEVR
jgi:hypothetical protein